MNISLLHHETALEKCPMCDGELYVARSVPRAGTACPFCREPLWFLQKKIDGVPILTVLAEGKHKLATAAWSDATIWSLKNAARAVVNLSRLTGVSDEFLDTLVAIQQKLKSAGGSLKICGATPPVAAALHDAELDAVLELYADEESAIDSFEQPTDPASMFLPLRPEPTAAVESGRMAAQA
jgi:anti-anti-sigma regulatory factor